MGTKIKALGTYRNKARLPGGLVRRGRIVEVADSYAEELVEGGKAEYVDEDTATENSNGAGADLNSTPLPDDTPKRDLLEGNEVLTLGDLRHFVENDLLTGIKGIGPATADELESFLEETLSELG